MSPIQFRLRWLGVFAALVALAVAAATAVGVGATWVSKQRTMRIARAISGGDPDRAPELIRRYGCGGCHTITGIPGADGQVGPPLSDLIHRLYIGGVAVNSADQLTQWIVSPQQFSPYSAMPTTGISEEEARDITAYLYSQ
jgi:cytochrome c